MSPDFGSRRHAADDAMARADWEDARTQFRAVLEHHPDDAGAHEGLAWASWWLNDAPAVFESRENAYRLYRDAGDVAAAARCAIWLGSDSLDFNAAFAVANGWLGTAERLLATLGTPVAEHAWLSLHLGAIALEVEEDAATGAARSADAAAIARELKLPSVELIAAAMHGYSLVLAGRVEEGMRSLDVAAAAATAGDVPDPVARGWSCCYLIYACERIRDYDRAAQWCDRMEKIAEQLRFRYWRGICRTHYAGVLMLRGEWDQAESELLDATRQLTQTRPPVAGEALVRLAELRRRQGRLDEALSLFRETDGHPLSLLGRAEAALDAGDPATAADLAEQHLRHVPDGSVLPRLHPLELRVRAFALAGRHDEARDALEDLRRIAQDVGTPSLRAACAYSSGVAAVATGNYDAARRDFEEALHLFSQVRAPYEAARAKLELAAVMQALGRPEHGELARAAAETLEAIGATGEAKRAAAVAEMPRPPDVHLTPRELEILKLVADGRSDREIASLLSLSEHTVHRHVANAMTRLDVSSRAAAVARAARARLL